MVERVFAVIGLAIVLSVGYLLGYLKGLDKERTRARDKAVEAQQEEERGMELRGGGPDVLEAWAAGSGQVLLHDVDGRLWYYRDGVVRPAKIDISKARALDTTTTEEPDDDLPLQALPRYPLPGFEPDKKAPR